MKNITLTVGLALLCSVLTVDSARAYQGAGSNLGFVPFGFYQPYGIRYSTSVRTPPYFALNPPVYYGSRYARPYGASPFASPPLVTAPASYQARLATEFAGPGPRPIGPTLCNPYCGGDLPGEALDSQQPAEEIQQGEMLEEETVSNHRQRIKLTRVGEIRLNPFVAAETVAQGARQRHAER